MPVPEKRKNLRRTVTYPAFLDFGDGSPPRQCTLCDASQEGAQLAVAEPDSLPDEFILALSSDGAARRRCRVAWRTETQIGVVFLKDVKKVQEKPAIRRPSDSTPAVESHESKESKSPAVKVDIDTLPAR